MNRDSDVMCTTCPCRKCGGFLKSHKNHAKINDVVKRQHCFLYCDDCTEKIALNVNEYCGSLKEHKIPPEYRKKEGSKYGKCRTCKCLTTYWNYKEQTKIKNDKKKLVLSLKELCAKLIAQDNRIIISMLESSLYIPKDIWKAISNAVPERPNKRYRSNLIEALNEDDNKEKYIAIAKSFSWYTSPVWGKPIVNL